MYFLTGSRNSTTSGRGGLWVAANLSGLSTRSSSSQLPEFNGRSASKDVTASASVMTNAKQTTSTVRNLPITYTDKVRKFKIYFCHSNFYVKTIPANVQVQKRLILNDVKA